MAGGWIKMTVGLRTNPHVVRISSGLKADRLRVIGALWAVWCVFDEHSADGRLEGYSFSVMDEEIGWPGFSAAMGSVGWLVETPDGALVAPDFDEHNGSTAKQRAQDTKRKRSARDADKGPPSERTEPGQVSASKPDKKRTREEKKREEKNTPHTPQGGCRFEDFWTAWPANDRKQDKVKCAKKWKADGLDAEADRILADLALKRQTQKWREGFVEAPLVYLNGRRWEDGVDPSSATAGGDDWTRAAA